METSKVSSKRNIEGTEETPRKSLKIERDTDNEDDVEKSSSTGDIPVAVKNTHIEDVFETEQAVTLKEAKEFFHDYDDPVILVLTKRHEISSRKCYWI